jgi:hypothetical protein
MMRQKLSKTPSACWRFQQIEQSKQIHFSLQQPKTLIDTHITLIELIHFCLFGQNPFGSRFFNKNMRRYRFENDDTVDGDLAINSLYTPRPEAHSRLSRHEAVPPLPIWVFLAFVIFSVAFIFVAFHEMHPEVEPLSQSLTARFYSHYSKDSDSDSQVMVLGSGLTGKLSFQSRVYVFFFIFFAFIHSDDRLVQRQTIAAERCSSDFRRHFQ